MTISDDDAKEAIDAGQTLTFAYPGITGEYVPANYHAYRNERSLFYCCDVFYETEGQRRPPQWGSRNFNEFVESLPNPARLTDKWEVLIEGVEGQHEPGGQQ